MRKINAILILFLFLIGCKKPDKSAQEGLPSYHGVVNNSRIAASGCQTYPIIDSMPATDANGDSTEVETILGSQRTNPYTVANMRQAYNNLGYSALPVMMIKYQAIPINSFLMPSVQV